MKHEDLPLTARLLGWQGLIMSGRRVLKYFLRWKKEEITLDAETRDRLAVNYWIRESQGQSFGEELTYLKQGKSIKQGGKLTNLCPFLDADNIMRANGRITKIGDFQFNNNPIILDGKHPTTRLLIIDYHKRFYHGSHNAVINEILQSYHIIGLRNALRFVVHRCLRCKLRRAKPVNQLMAPLPLGRLAYKMRPFSHCGMDYFGPLQVKIGRRREKRWGVLFTCLTVRAVHLEIAHSLSASSTIMALQRLAARRGAPMVIYSDNGTNFRGACKELRDKVQAIDKTKQREYALRNGIRWSFNPPDAPHMGGAWERLIRSVKIALYACLNDQAPSEETMLTLFSEIEHSINSRPLTHVSGDPRDSEALTPNHFLLGTSSGAIKLGSYDPKEVNLKKQWQIGQAFADSFWKRWLREYLPTISVRTKWSSPEKQLQINDLVLIIDLQAPRNVWKKGKIVQVFPGNDGVVRVARVVTKSGEFVRPTNRLIKLFNEDEVQN